MSTLLNTLYTPLDCPPRPAYDVVALKEWITEYHVKLAEIRSYMKQGAGIGNKTETIWTPVNPYNKFFLGWQGDFDKKFPELANYFTSAFGLTENDITNILILPINKEYTGKFWRQDPDEYGLRMFLDLDENSSTKMYVKKTIEPYTEQPALSARHFPEGHAPNIVEFLQQGETECKLVSPSQCYYVNNVRGSHATDVTSLGESHITVIVYHNKSFPVIRKITALVERSLEKYKDYAITY